MERSLSRSVPARLIESRKRENRDSPVQIGHVDGIDQGFEDALEKVHEGRKHRLLKVIEIVITITILSAREKAVGCFFEPEPGPSSRPRFPYSPVRLFANKRPKIGIVSFFADGIDD